MDNIENKQKTPQIPVSFRRFSELMSKSNNVKFTDLQRHEQLKVYAQYIRTINRKNKIS